MIEWNQDLRAVGIHLDADRDLTVWRGGIVRPSDLTSTSNSMGEVSDHGSERQRQETRSTIRSQQGITRREGPPRGSRPPRPTSPLVLGDFAPQYEKEIAALADHYPSVSHFPQDGGIWLRVESALLRGYGGKALLCVSIPYAYRIPRAWAFLRSPVGEYSWVGPRHTNYPDGSICAFHMDDNT